MPLNNTARLCGILVHAQRIRQLCKGENTMSMKNKIAATICATTVALTGLGIAPTATAKEIGNYDQTISGTATNDGINFDVSFPDDAKPGDTITVRSDYDFHGPTQDLTLKGVGTDTNLVDFKIRYKPFGTYYEFTLRQEAEGLVDRKAHVEMSGEFSEGECDPGLDEGVTETREVEFTGVKIFGQPVPITTNATVEKKGCSTNTSTDSNPTPVGTIKIPQMKCGYTEFVDFKDTEAETVVNPHQIYNGVIEHQIAGSIKISAAGMETFDTIEATFKFDKDNFLAGFNKGDFESLEEQILSDLSFLGSSARRTEDSESVAIRPGDWSEEFNHFRGGNEYLRTKVESVTPDIENNSITIRFKDMGGLATPKYFDNDEPVDVDTALFLNSEGSFEILIRGRGYAPYVTGEEYEPTFGEFSYRTDNDLYKGSCTRENEEFVKSSFTDNITGYATANVKDLPDYVPEPEPSEEPTPETTTEESIPETTTKEPTPETTTEEPTPETTTEEPTPETTTEEPTPETTTEEPAPETTTPATETPVTQEKVVEKVQSKKEDGLARTGANVGVLALLGLLSAVGGVMFVRRKTSNIPQ